MTTKSDTMNICAVLEKLEEIWLHLIDFPKHSNQHDQSKIDKVNHRSFNDLKKYVLPWLIVIIAIKTGHQLVEQLCAT